MRLILVPAALLCLTWVYQVDAIHGPAADCCPGWSTTKVPMKLVMNYTIQHEGVCPIKAIIIKTIQKKTICSNPDDGWAKRAMKEVDMREALLQPILGEEDGSAEDTTPSVTATKRPRKQKGRKGRKGQRRN